MTFRRIIKYTLAVIALVIVAEIAFIYTVAHYRPALERADAIIVLGAAINTPALYNRTLQGLRLYEEGQAETMVLSGGKIADADISEAEYMEKVIKKNASKAVRYIKEEQSHSTYDNIKNSKALLGDADSIIIVSDQFHLARAMLLAKRAGFEKVYWSAPEPSYYSGEDLRFYYFREMVAMLSYIPKFIKG